MNKVDFLLHADELSAVITVLQNALTRRPNPRGEPWFDLQTARASCDEFFESLWQLEEACGTLSTDDLLQAAKGMSSGYHRFWRRPFPPGLEMGQPLFSSVLERPMRDLLRSLQSLMKDGSSDSLDNPLLTLDAEEEMNCFVCWLDGLPAHQRIAVQVPQNTQPSQKTGLVALAASFFLGWWLGQD